MNSSLLPVWVMLAGSMTAVALADGGAAAAQSSRPTAAAARPAPASEQTQQDEYTRVELMPEIGSLTVTHEVAVTTPGATEWTMPLRHGLGKNVIAVTDMMTGQPLKFGVTPDGDELRVTLARPIAGEGGQARLRVTTTAKESLGYRRLDQRPASGGVVKADEVGALPRDAATADEHPRTTDASTHVYCVSWR